MKLQEDKQNVKSKEKDAVTQDETDELKERTSISGSGYRGISDATLKTFGVRTEYDESTGDVKAVYYPCTEKGELSGWKPRLHPKKFGGSIGRTGKTCDMFGQFKFKNGGKVCLIVGGEHDQLAAYQMLKEYGNRKGWDFDPVVVSPTVGETGCEKQIQANYEFFNQYSKVIIGLDNDDAGKKATEKIAKVLPKNKVYIASWSLKDPNEMLEKGKEKQFISDFYDAKQYLPAGVVPSTQIYERMLETSHVEKVKMPEAFGTLNDMLGGGLALGHAYSISGITGGGKTTLTLEMVYEWIFNSPHLVGIVSMELTAPQYGEVLLSRHLQTKIARMSPDEKTNFLKSEEVKKAAKELFEKEDGSPRFLLVDDRDASLEQMQEIITQMVISSDVKVVVIDPWNDLATDGLTIPEQELAVKWVKSMIKSHGICVVLICHLRKSSGGEKDVASGAKYSESALIGSSALTKSMSANILLVRDKLAEDPILRNCTQVFLAKNRLLSETGPAGMIYYDSDESKLYDYDKWLDENS